MLHNLKYQDIETIALVIFTLIFIVMEKVSPKHKDLEVKSLLKLDFFAFVLIVTAINVSRPGAGGILSLQLYTA